MKKTPMLNYFRNLVREMFPGLAGRAGGRTPGQAASDARDRGKDQPTKTTHTQTVKATTRHTNVTKHTREVVARTNTTIRDVQTRVPTIRNIIRVNMPAIQNKIKLDPVIRNRIVVNVYPVIPNVNPRMAPNTPPITPTRSPAPQETNIYVTTSNDASLDTKVRHALFAAEQRYRGRH